MTTSAGTLAVLALGTNLGDKLSNLERAADAVDLLPQTRVLCCGRVFRSAPWGDTDQPEFLNTAIGIETTLSPHELLAETQRLERELGKKVVRKWGPRLIDIDILAFGDETVEEPDFHVPHKRMSDRPFVYWPFADVAERLDWPHDWRELAASTDEGRAIEPETEGLDDAGPVWPCDLSEARPHYVCGSEQETEALAEAFGRVAVPGMTLGLDGPLGAGKTCFVRGFARGLGVTSGVQSPSYTLCRAHEGGRLPLAHWDFYRMTSPDDLESAGFFEQDPRAVKAIEWASMFDEELGESAIRVTIERDTVSEERRLQFSFPRGMVAVRAALAKAATREAFK